MDSAPTPAHSSLSRQGDPFQKVNQITPPLCSNAHWLFVTRDPSQSLYRGPGPKSTLVSLAPCSPYTQLGTCGSAVPRPHLPPVGRLPPSPSPSSSFSYFSPYSEHPVSSPSQPVIPGPSPLPVFFLQNIYHHLLCNALY